MVPCYLVTPQAIEPGNHNRLLVGLHSGGWVFSAGEASAAESILMASTTGIRTIAIDYRMLPQHPFPAAMDDITTVWREITKSVKPQNIGVFGSSVGGSMALLLVQRAMREGVPIPGAVMSGTPWSDLSKTGDSY